MALEHVEIFREKLAELPREEILQIIEEQDPEILRQIKRIEFIFEKKLTHLTWSDGSPIEGKPLTNKELSLLVDPPFSPDPQLTLAGITEKQQRELHVASDPVLWAREFLGSTPRAYQILMLRDPSLRKVFRLGRRAGKTHTMAILLLHYSYTTPNGRCLVMAPMKSQVGLIYDEVLMLARKRGVADSFSRYVTSPQYEISLTNGSTIRFFTTGLKSGGKCLTPDHDVLTSNGWLPVGKVNPGDTVMGWQDGVMNWTEVSDTWEYAHDGDLVTHSGKQLSFRVTPNHKFATRTSGENAKWKERQAKDLKGLLQIPTAGETPVGTKKDFSGAELEMWGWWLSEGSGFDSNMARISQTKPDGRKRIVEVAKELGIHYNEYEREIRVSWKPPIYSGTNAYNKFIPRELFDEFDRSRLLDGLLAGDGWIRENGGWEYFSSSYQLAEDVQELAIREGMRANIREKKINYKPVGGGIANRHWITSAYPYEYAYTSPKLLSTEHYKGPVHCITVPDSGFFLTRHNGIIHITGNSDVARGQEAHVIVLDEMDYMGNEDLDALYAMLQKTDENQPDKMLIGASTPTGRRERFWSWCTRNDRFKEFYYPSYCFPEGQEVRMGDGSYKEIQNVQVGDEVMTEKGAKTVTRTFSREYEGDLLDIQTYGSDSWISVTPEHPFRAAKRDYKQYPSYKGIRSEPEFSWVNAKDLTCVKTRNQNSGHWIYSPVNMEEKDFLIDCSLLHKDFDGDTRVGVVRHFPSGVGQDFKNSMPRVVSSRDDALATILGWYAAEGHVEGFSDQYGFHRIVGWTLSSTEWDVVTELQEALDKFEAGKLTVKDNRVNGQNSLTVRLANPILAELCKSLIGVGSLEKRLDERVMFAPKDFQTILFDCYSRGDGWSHSAGVDVRTSSFQLSRQIRDLFARISGWYPSITRSDPRSTKNGYVQQESWLLNCSDSGRSMLGKRGVDGGFALLVKNIKKRDFKGIVYNFEVEDTNSYIVDSLLVHNCNPFWTKKDEDEMRDIYTEMAYRHEIEADWGEDAEGVYPHKYVDVAFVNDWTYSPGRTSARSKFIIGVDWDKYGAGPNIVVLEICDENYEDETFAGKIRVAFREEIPRSEYVLTEAIERIIELNRKFNPAHIYVDRGYGEMQIELLHQYGLEHPETNLKKRVVGISFAGSLEVKDPATKQPVKKDMKAFMVENLRSLLERGQILMPQHDEELYMQLISYIVVRTTQSGKPVFEASGTQQDHAHDALILAALAYSQNYDELLRTRYTTTSKSFSNEFFMPEKMKKEIDYPDEQSATTQVKRSNLGRSRRSKGRIHVRKMF